MPRRKTRDSDTNRTQSSVLQPAVPDSVSAEPSCNSPARMTRSASKTKRTATSGASPTASPAKKLCQSENPTPPEAPVLQPRMTNGSPVANNDQVTPRRKRRLEPASRAHETEVNGNSSPSDSNCRKKPRSTVPNVPLDFTKWPDEQVGEPMTSRGWLCLPDYTPQGQTFTAVSYNILSETLLKKSSYFDQVSPDSWDRKKRHELILKEVDFLQPDVLCLQEVERGYFDNLLAPALKQRGLTVHFAASQAGDTQDGVCTAFRSGLFRQFSVQTVSLSNAADDILDTDAMTNDPQKRRLLSEDIKVDNSALVVTLRSLRSGRPLVVGNAHVSYLHHARPDVRCLQIAGVLRTMQAAGAKAELAESSTGGAALLLAGDLNSTPDSVAMQLVKDGYLSDESIVCLQSVRTVASGGGDSEALVNLLWPAFQHPVTDLESAYESVVGREPPLTSAPASNTGCLDYLICGQSLLKAYAVLQPRCRYMSSRLNSLPDSALPSDHLSLAARLDLL